MELILNRYNFFSIEKTVQIFYYIQKHSRTTSKLELIKFLFFADRIHLRKYFSLISLDNYVALKYGPVASNSLDVLNNEIDYLSNFRDDELKFLKYVQQTGQTEWTIKEVPNDLLSNNEMQSIDKSINIFSGMYLSDISHDYPEWKRYKNFFDMRLISSRPIKMDDFFKNPDINDSPAIQKYFGDNDPLYEDEEYLNEAKEFYLQSIGEHG